VHGTLIVRWIFKEIGSEDMNWVHLARDRVQWRALVNTVMNPSGFIKKLEIL
jgi:hypothetical protein